MCHLKSKVEIHLHHWWCCLIHISAILTSLVAQTVCLQCGRPGFNPWVGKISWRRKWQPTPVPLPGKSNGWKSLVGYSQGCKESDMISLSLSVAGGIEFIFLLDYQAVVSVFRGWKQLWERVHSFFSTPSLYTFPPTCYELGEGFLLSCGSRKKETLKVGVGDLGPWLKQGRARLNTMDGG